jgi:hypothetical protein
MGFDWGSFSAGFVQEAGEQVGLAAKEARERTKSELEKLEAEVEDNKKRNQTKRDELRTLSSQLAGYTGAGGVGFSDQQKVALLQNPAIAKDVIKTLSNNKEKLSSIDFNKLANVASSPTSLSLEDYLNTVGTFKKVEAKPREPAKEKGPFGLNLAARERVLSGYERSGKSIAQLKSEAAGITEDMPRADVTLDFSQFAEPTKAKSLDGLRNEFAEIIANTAGNTNLERIENAKSSQKGLSLWNQIVAREALEPDSTEDGAKDRTTSAIRTVLGDNIRSRIAPLQFKGVTYDSNIGDFVVTMPGTPEAAEFERTRQNVLSKAAVEMGIIDSKGNVVAKSAIGKRNILDALQPFANVDYENNRILGWKKPANEVKDGGPADKPKPQSFLPIPRLPNGDIDVSKLQKGVRYGAQGKIWNGTTFQ